MPASRTSSQINPVAERPLALKDIGMKRGDLARAASLVMQAPYYNPRPTDRESVLALLDDAFCGKRP